MNDLIPLTENDHGEKAVSARELFNFLEVSSDFSTWCKRMFAYGFQEEEDFSSILMKTSNSKGGRPIKDYVLTLDTAKEIAMLQRTDRGKMARKYFIEVEKRARALSKDLSPAEQLLQNAQLLVEQEKKLSEHDQRINQLEAKTTTLPEYYTVAGYANLNNISVNLRLASRLGQKASILCKKRGLMMDKTPDPRFGTVRMYPKRVLNEVFNTVNLT